MSDKKEPQSTALSLYGKPIEKLVLVANEEQNNQELMNLLTSSEDNEKITSLLKLYEDLNNRYDQRIKKINIKRKK